jgi:hypothetical protein
MEQTHPCSNWANLQSHNDFLAGRMEEISQTPYQENQALMQEYGIPNWSQEEWTEMKTAEDSEHLKFTANVPVTVRAASWLFTGFLKYTSRQARAWREFLEPVCILFLA